MSFYCRLFDSNIEASIFFLVFGEGNREGYVGKAKDNIHKKVLKVTDAGQTLYTIYWPAAYFIWVALVFIAKGIKH